MKIPFFVLLLFFQLFSLSLVAQTMQITGTVRDASTGEPLIGVTVVIKGSQTGTITNLEGYYSIETTRGATLFSAMSVMFLKK